MLPLFDSQPLLPLVETVRNALADGSIVVTANARSARSLALQYAEQQRSNGIEMWASPAIFDWDTWLNSLWHEHLFSNAESPLLLTRLQEHSLWKRVQQADAMLVVSPDGMASLAQSAYALLSDYRRHAMRNTEWLEVDAEHFRQWAKMFDQLCRDQKWASRSDLANRLSLAARAGRLILPKHMLLVGFDRFTPAQQGFLHNIREAGVIAEEFIQPPEHHAANMLIVADDLNDELLACARWCRRLLEHNSAIRIGVIAPDISSIRAKTERTFRAVLMPQSLDLASEAGTMPFEFSLGVPLSSIPVVRAALLLLRWIVEPLSEEQITWLLLSGFFSDNDSETQSLAQFDFKQRNAGSLSPETSLQAFTSRRAPNPFSKRARELLRAVDKSHALTDTNTCIAWTELAEQLLSLAGWPGFRTPDSVQFQAQRRWIRVLDEVALLDFSGRKNSFSNYLQTLERQADETIFTSESHQAPIQILGALESSGQTFDAIWFLEADDSQWPPTGRPHPLLPTSLQREAQMPHSSAAIDADLGYLVAKRLAESTTQITFSYARQNKEGELRPSPLLATIFGAENRPIPTTEFCRQLDLPEDTKREITIESVVLASGTAAWPQERIAGGADILKEQAACPFQAFATRRLAARPLKRTDWGLDAAKRGSLLHDILENIWSPDTPDPFRMVTLDDLKNVVAAQHLDDALRYHIRNAFHSLIREHEGEAWAQAYFESEQIRLLTRLREWMLHHEAVRQSFEVKAREQRLQDVHVGELKLNLRADRIDLLPDGSHLLIDYKSGEVSTADWQGERLDEPQLPLYAAYGNVENVSGLLFAQIRAGKTAFVGRVANAQQRLQANLSASSSLVNQPYDDSMRDEWQNALLHLAEEFLRGESSVDPKHGAKTCKYCPLPGLCRVAETESAEGGDVEADHD